MTKHNWTLTAKLFSGNGLVLVNFMKLPSDDCCEEFVHGGEKSNVPVIQGIPWCMVDSIVAGLMGNCQCHSLETSNDLLV